MTLLIRNSLDEALATGRRELSWEEVRLAQVSTRAPYLPEVIMENAHLAVLKGDTARARDLLVEAQPFERILQRAVLYRYYYAMLAGDRDSAAQLRGEAVKQGVPEPLLRPLTPATGTVR